MSIARSALGWSILAATLVSAAQKTPTELKAEKKAESAYGPQPATEQIDLTMYARIREEGLRHSHVMQFANALERRHRPPPHRIPQHGPRQRLDPRHPSPPSASRNAHLEDWGEFGMGWQQINTWVRMASPDPEPLWAEATPWSPATKGPVTGPAIWIDLQDAADLDKFKGKLAGKIVLLGATPPQPPTSISLSSSATPPPT